MRSSSPLISDGAGVELQNTLQTSVDEIEALVTELWDSATTTSYSVPRGGSEGSSANS
jgi:catalase (peroxidase I)